jgi:hypothetical protein
MSFLGHIENGSVVFDTPLPLPNGTQVKVEAVPAVDRNGPPPGETARNLAIDDSRESIYD